MSKEFDKSASVHSTDKESQNVQTVKSDGKLINIVVSNNELDPYMARDEPVVLDEKTDRKLLRKIDLFVLPLVCILYAVQFMDKLSNSYASIMGLRTDLGMHGDMFSWTGSAFYIGYLAFEFPCAYALQRFPVVSTVSVFIIIWGVILCLHSVTNYAGFIALRTILGALESSVTPAFVIVTSQWYKKEEVFLRTSIWFSFNGLGLILGSGAISYNLYRHMGSYSIEEWKLIFIITGVITIALGIVIFFHIPNKPTEAWFLSETEKRNVVERIRANQQGFGNKHFKKYQLIEALTDIKIWLFCFMILSANIPNGGLTNFGSILLNESFGYGVGESLKFQMIPGAVQLVGCIGFAYMYRFFPNRLFWASSSNAVAILGVCLLAFAEKKEAQLGGYVINNFIALVMICGLSSFASNVAGHTKKVVGNAMFLIAYCVGNLIGPQTFRESQAPDYNGAKIAMVVCSIASLLFLISIWVVMKIENKRKDARGDQSEFEKIENHEFADLTDKENPLFRYVL